jgi:hypothetical protein
LNAVVISCRYVCVSVFDRWCRQGFFF